MSAPEVKPKDARLLAAEDTCYAILLMMQLGVLDDIPREWFEFLAHPLTNWVALKNPPVPEPPASPE